MIRLTTHPFLRRSKILKKYRTLLISSASFLVLLMVITPLEYSFFIQKAYADGLSVENLPPASVGNRQLSLYLKVNPPLLTTACFS
jgi:hypothetical protein